MVVLHSYEITKYIKSIVLQRVFIVKIFERHGREKVATIQFHK